MLFADWIRMRHSRNDARTLLVRVMRMKQSNVPTNNPARWYNFITWEDFLLWMIKHNAKPYTLKVGKALWREYTRCMRNLDKQYGICRRSAS